MKPQSLGNSEDFYHKIVWKAKSLKFKISTYNAVKLYSLETFEDFFFYLS